MLISSVFLIFIILLFNYLYRKVNEKVWKYQMFHWIIQNFNFCSHINFNEFPFFQLIPCVLLYLFAVDIFSLYAYMVHLITFILPFGQCNPTTFLAFTEVLSPEHIISAFSPLLSIPQFFPLDIIVASRPIELI